MQIHCRSWKVVFLAAMSAGPFRPENKTPNRLRTLALLSLVLVATFAHAAPDQFATQVLADGPFGYWRLGEMPGATSALDSSPNGNNGTYNTPGITLGQPGINGGDTAVLFDGSGDGRVVVRNSGTLNPSVITMEAKVRWDGPNREPTQQRILEKSYTSNGDQAEYGMSIFDFGELRGHVRVELRTGLGRSVDPVCNIQGNVVCANSRAVVAPGVETYVVATYDKSVIRIYINGNLDSETPANDRGGPIEDPSVQTPPLITNLGLGNQDKYLPPIQPRPREVNGLIDELALYDKVLSADRILAHYKSQFEGPAFQYAVKFVCGKSDGRIVAPGAYFTAINVHNPTNGTVGFKKKFVIAGRYEKPGPKPVVSSVREFPSDFATEIDCEDIFKHLAAGQPTASFLKGFVVIESAVELDVVAVYTAAGATGRVETMEIERVQPRRQIAEGKPDLVPVPDPNTGNFCRRKELKLTVTVKNQGSALAGPSTTTVDFGAAGSASQFTPELLAGNSVDLVFDIPPSCFRPDCHFRITVDSSSQVDESNELNNTAVGVCPG